MKDQSDTNDNGIHISGDKKDVTITISDKKNNNHPSKWFGRPPDAGFSWIALAAGFVIVVLYTSTGPMFGIIFVHKIKQFKMSSLNVALVFNCLSFVWNFILTMSGPLNEHLGWRKVGMVASFFCSSAIFITSFTTNKYAVYFSFSLLSGIGGGLAFSTSLYVVSNYFLVRRGLAMALLGSAIGIGQLTLPLFLRYLQSSYGFHGAALIYSAFLLHGVVAAAFFHPIEKFHPKEIKNKYDASYLSEQSAKAVTETHHNNLAASYCSLTSVKSKFNTLMDMSRNIFQLSVNNVVNLKSPVVAILAISGGCKMVSFLNIMLMLPLSLVAKGLTLQDAAYCFSITGISSIFSRVVIPLLSDFKGVNATSCYVAGEVLVAVACLAYTFTSEFSYIALCFGILGAGMGASMSLHPIVLIEYKGVDDMPRTYGSYGFISAILFITVGPLVGYLRDITGSYSLMYRIFAGILMFAALIWILMPFALKYEKKTTESSEENKGSIL